MIDTGWWARRWLAFVAVVAAASAGACGLGAGGDGPQRHVRTVSALDVDDGGWVAIDLTDPDLIVYIDHSQGAIDYSRISLTCPNGSGMPLDFWIEFEARRLGESARTMGRQMVLLAADGPGAEERENDESDSCLECHLCPDGLTVCQDMCAEGASGARDPWRWRSCPWLVCEDSSEDVGPFIDDGPQPNWNDLWGATLPGGDGEGSGEQDEPGSWTPGGSGGGGDGDDDDYDDDDGSSGWASGGGSGWGSGGSGSGGGGSGGSGGGGYAGSPGN